MPNKSSFLLLQEYNYFTNYRIHKSISMRTILLIMSFLLTTIISVAQDTLYKTDGTKHSIKTVEINETQVKYKLSTNPNGPIYVLNKENIIKIINESGLIDIFSIKAIKNIVKDPRNIDFGRNLISLNVSDFLFNFLTLGYEYTFKSGKYSIKCPLSFGLYSKPKYKPQDYWGGYYYYQGAYKNAFNKFSTGLDFNFYPFGQGKSKLFLGPSILYGQFYFINLDKEIGTYYDFLFQTGILFQPLKHINFSLNAGIGIGHSNSINFGAYSNTGIAARGGLNIGYKF